MQLSNERTHADVSQVVRSLEGCQINVLYGLPRTPALIKLRQGFTGDNTHRGMPRVTPPQALCCAQNLLILPLSHIIVFPRNRLITEKSLEIFCWLVQAESLASRYLNPLCAYAEKYQTFFEYAAITCSRILTSLTCSIFYNFWNWSNVAKYYFSFYGRYVEWNWVYQTEKKSKSSSEG